MTIVSDSEIIIFAVWIALCFVYLMLYQRMKKLYFLFENNSPISEYILNYLFQDK